MSTNIMRRRGWLFFSAAAAAFGAGSFSALSTPAARAQTPAQTPVRPQVVDLHVYHPAGNGVTDDASLLQAAVNVTPPGGTLMFEAGRRYAISRPIDCRGKAIHIDGCNSTVVITNGAFPSNSAFHFGALLAGAPEIGRPYNAQQPPPPTVTFSEALKAGETAFACTLPATLTVGSYVSANFGTCPTDKTLPDVSYLARIVENSGGIVTLDAPLPRDVHGNTHSFYGVVSLGDNSSIKNIGLDWAAGITPDIQISVDYCRNFRAENLFGRFAIAVNATYARDVSVDGVNGDCVLVSPSAGRVFGGWHVEGFVIKNVLVNQSRNAPVFFLEGGARDGLIDNVIVNAADGPAPWVYGVVHLDATQNLRIRGLTINGSTGSKVVLVSDGTSNSGNHSGVTFEDVRTNMPLNVANMREIRSGVINGVALGDPVMLHYSVPITGASGRILHLARGMVRRLYVKLPDHVTGICFRQNAAGPAITTVKPGTWQALVDGFSVYPWNDPTMAGVEECVVKDDGHLAPDAKIEVFCDTFPCGGEFPAE